MSYNDKNYRYLITGSNGIIGSHVQRKLDSIADNITVIQFEGDLTNISETQSIIDTAGPLNGVIHLAAMVAVESVRADPAQAWAVNVGGTINLLKAVVRSGQTPHVLYCSSAHVYASTNSAISEKCATEPISLYGRTKLAAEIAAFDICNSANIPLCIGRIFSIHDPCQVGSYLRPNILARLSVEDLSKPFDLHGADSIRDFLTAEEAAKIITLLARHRYEGTINIGSGRPTSIREFVQDLARRELNIRHVGNRDSILADTTKLNKLLGEWHDLIE